MFESMKSTERAHVFSAPLSESDMVMLKRVSAKEDVPMANLFRRWVRAEFARQFPNEKA